MKNWKFVILVLAFITILLIISKNVDIVNIEGDQYILINLRTNYLKRRGLSKISWIPKFLGTEFNFEDDSKVAFWMKDMKFPIDMYFLDKNLNIVKRECNIQPCTSSDCPVVIVDDVADVVEIKPRADCSRLHTLKL
jgi:uncharacterized membrane protein (UPF0127 family)